MRMGGKIEESARKLAEMNAENEPAISEIYLFPNENEIRLVSVDASAPFNDEQITPYFFPPDPQNGIHFPCALALIQPEEKGLVGLPESWGTWANAVMIYQRLKTPEQNYVDF